MLYQYNIESGEYAMTLPFETEIKEGLTDIQPPETRTNQVAVFNVEKQEWKIFKDYRFTHKMLKGNEIFDIVDFGNIPTGYTLITNEQAEELAEKKRIEMLKMTPLDFINFLVSCGLTLEQINAFLESHLAIKMQLTYCQFVYCGVAKSLMPITVEGVTITAEMVEQAFIKKHEEEIALEENSENE